MVFIGLKTLENNFKAMEQAISLHINVKMVLADGFEPTFSTPAKVNGLGNRPCYASIKNDTPTGIRTQTNALEERYAIPLHYESIFIEY